LTKTKVTGISYEFLQHQSFYGFHSNESFFFTDSHIFTGPDNDDQGIKFYVKNVDLLLSQNPLMEFIDFTEMENGTDFSVFHFSNNSVSSKTVQVYKDPLTHPGDSKVYFLQVDSPHGTYFANGYACRHETPPLNKWPNTMNLLFSVFSRPEFQTLSKVPYTFDNLLAFNKTVKEISVAIFKTLDNLQEKFHNVEDCKSEPDRFFDDEMKENFGNKVINDIYNSPSFSAVAVGVYGATAKEIANYLDNNGNKSSVIIQNLLYNSIVESFKKSWLRNM
jgi:hypothetical protein